MAPAEITTEHVFLLLNEVPKMMAILDKQTFSKGVSIGRSVVSIHYYRDRNMWRIGSGNGKSPEWHSVEERTALLYAAKALRKQVRELVLDRMVNEYAQRAGYDLLAWDILSGS